MQKLLEEEMTEKGGEKGSERDRAMTYYTLPGYLSLQREKIREWVGSGKDSFEWIKRYAKKFHNSHDVIEEPDLVKRLGVILGPNGRPWEEDAVFNGAIAELDGKIELLYRAFGKDETSKWRREGVSRFGLATSDDGFNYIRSEEPVFKPEVDDEREGVEDPRLTWVPEKNRFYMTYTATRRVEDDVVARVALASTTDFKNFERYGVILRSNEDRYNKDAVLFPERINGSFAMLHRRDGRGIWLAYSDDLTNWGQHQLIMKPGEGWDGAKIGAGAPPVKTKYGWLEVYHGVDKDNIYSLGIALLDLRDPSKVLMRYGPILKPKMEYERNGLVPNVVFTCGLVERKDDYLMPYGAADKVIAEASINKAALEKVLDKAA